MSEASTTYTADQFLEKLKSALSKDGDFPASARIVNELRLLITNPKTTANQVAEVILREPSLGIRVLHLVNSTFYRRAKPIMTVSQAVIQIGMKPLAELCSGLVLLQKFVPAARSGGAFSHCLQKLLLSSLVTSSINSENRPQSGPESKGESGYLAGTFSEIGTLLLAYYFPHIYENALKRSQSKRQDVEKSIYEIVGLTPSELSQEIISSLSLPEFYGDILKGANELSGPATKKAPAASQNEITRLAKSVHAAQKISTVLVFSKDKGELDKVLTSLSTALDFDSKMLANVLSDLPKIFQSHCIEIDLTLPPLPEFVSSYSNEVPIVTSAATGGEQSEDFTQFADEIREAVENGEPTASVITTVMETMTWGLKFDRVLLLLVGAGRKRLVGRMMLGNTGETDPQKIERAFDSDLGPYAPDLRAFREGHPVFQGDPVLRNGWPLVAMPIGFGQRCIGVIYADRVSSNATELTGRDQAAIGVLAELLDRSIGKNK